MPYQVKKYDGTELVTVPDYQYNDTATTVVLFGKGVTNYGQPMAENLVHLLENFAGATPPGLPARLGEPLVGQLWYDTINRKLRVRSPTTNWDVVGAANVGATPPSPPNAGDLWLDTSTDPAKLKIYNGTKWQLVGSSAAASSTATTATSGNAVADLNNYFTNSNLGQNVEPQMGDLWFDPSIARLKVYNGKYWQIVGTPTVGRIDSLNNIPSTSETVYDDNSRLRPTSTDANIISSTAGEYHTSSLLGPSQGVFAVGDLTFSNLKKQLLVQTVDVGDPTANIWATVGPQTPYQIDPVVSTKVRGLAQTSHFYTGDDQDMVVQVVAPSRNAGGSGAIPNAVQAVWANDKADVSNLPTNWEIVHGPDRLTFNINDSFNNDTLANAGRVTRGLNLSSNFLMHYPSNYFGIGEIRDGYTYDDDNATIRSYEKHLFFLSSENGSASDGYMKLYRYHDIDSEAQGIVIARAKGTKVAPSNINASTTLGFIDFQGLVDKAITSPVNGTRKVDVSAAKIVVKTLSEDGETINNGTIPGLISFETNQQERFRIYDTYVRTYKIFENIRTSGTSSAVGTMNNRPRSTESPGYTFTSFRGTGVSSITGSELNLAVNSVTQLQARSGGGTLYDNWIISGNLEVDGISLFHGNAQFDGKINVVGTGTFNKVITYTLQQPGKDPVPFEKFIRNDNTNDGAASRLPEISANPDASNVNDVGGLSFGSATQRWGIFWGVAHKAAYADLAERYHTKEEYPEGTVVKISDDPSWEIEQTTEAFDEEAFGVISHRPAYSMNDNAGDDKTHPYVALSGRVPCRVIGVVRKGQRIVSSDIPGVGMAMPENDSSKIFCVIGRALKSKGSDGEDLIEIVVGKN